MINGGLISQKEKTDFLNRSEVKALLEAERKRVEREREQKEAAEAESERRRQEDEKHRRKINNLISQALYEEAGLYLEPTKKVIIAIAKGKIPNVKINY